jgi:hypothetical protein
MRSIIRILLVAIIFCHVAQNEEVRAQYSSSRVIITAVPYLEINPDARSAGLGSLGAASTHEENIDGSVDGAYSYRISPVFSAALAATYIYSNLTQGQYIQGSQTSTAHSVAFDLTVYYQRPLEIYTLKGMNCYLAWIQCLNKTSYTL